MPMQFNAVASQTDYCIATTQTGVAGIEGADPMGTGAALIVIGHQLSVNGGIIAAGIGALHLANALRIRFQITLTDAIVAVTEKEIGPESTAHRGGNFRHHSSLLIHGRRSQTALLRF